MSINWKKLPSVTREGKSFYRGKHQDGTIYTVSQSWLNDMWTIEDDFRHCQFPQFFKTAQQAMRAVEQIGLPVA